MYVETDYCMRHRVDSIRKELQKLEEKCNQTGDKIKEEKRNLGKVFSKAKNHLKQTLAKWYFSFCIIIVYFILEREIVCWRGKMYKYYKINTCRAKPWWWNRREQRSWIFTKDSCLEAEHWSEDQWASILNNSLEKISYNLCFKHFHHGKYNVCKSQSFADKRFPNLFPFSLTSRSTAWQT